MKITAAFAAIALVAATLAGVWYESHPSPQFKRTLTALVDPTSTKDDVHAYLREARVQASTRADKKLLTEAERAIALDVEADGLSASNFATLMAETKDAYEFCHPFYDEMKLVKENPSSVSASEVKRLDDLKTSARDERAKNSKDLNGTIDLQKNDSEESRRLLDDLRDALGAPGKGRYVANMAPTYEVMAGIKKQDDAIQKIPEDFMDEMESETIANRAGVVSAHKHKVAPDLELPLARCADTDWKLPCRT